MHYDNTLLISGCGKADELLCLTSWNFHAQDGQIAISGASFKFGHEIVGRS
jgi:hypothetical protein